MVKVNGDIVTLTDFTARQISEAQAARPKTAYFPFGAGARVCIGESFAWMEGVLLLDTISQQWIFARGPDVDPVAFITLRPKSAMRMRARARDKQEIEIEN